MGKIVSRGQALEVSARVATQVDWDALVGDNLQKDVISLTSEEFGRRFTDFLKNGCQFIFGEPKSILTKSFNPAEFIDKDWAVWKGPADGDGFLGEEDMDPRSLALAEVEISSLLFETCLNEGERNIGGEEKLRRLKEKQDVIRLGGNVFLGLWLDYQARKENSILEFLYRTKEIKYLDFFGLILRRSDGSRYVPCLYCDDDGKWDWYYNWLVYVWGADYPSVVRAS